MYRYKKPQTEAKAAPSPAVDSPHDTVKELIDRNHLAIYTLNDPALEREILTLFVDQLPETMNRIRHAVTKLDWKLATHTLKGSARAVGAWQLAAIAERAEKAISSPEQWPAHTLNIKTNVAATICYVQGLCAEPI